MGAWHQLSLVWRELGRVDRVIEAATTGLWLAEEVGGLNLLVAALHGALGTSLIEAGRYAEAIAALSSARATLSDAGLDERRMYVELFAKVARELRGEAVDWAELAGASGRVGHLVAAASGRVLDPEALAFADATCDPGLRGFVEALAGLPLADGVARCSYEARIGVLLRARRCHIGSHG